MSNPEPDTEANRSDLRTHALAALALVGLTALLFGDVLFVSPDLVASHPRGDAARYFLAVRSFAFGEMARGNLPLWNPWVFSGAPLLSAFQPALLYPANVLYLLFPTERAIDLDFSLHLFLAGLFTFAWVRARGLHGLAAFLAAVVLVCGSAFSLRVLAGQLSLTAAMAWAPLLLLAVDKLLERPSLGWTLAGIVSLTMQLLAGYPVGAFSTGVAVSLYAGLRLLACERRLAKIGALASVAIAPLFLAAAQLWPGLETAAETVRGGGVPYEFATSFSFPPENLITLWAPGFFGNVLDTAYWGRWYFWDATFYVGVLGLLLVLHGAAVPKRQVRIACALLVVLVCLSLGRYTPLYALFYRLVPGFDAFRAPSKLLFQASLFAALLAGIGADRLLREARGARGLALLAAAFAALLSVCALWVHTTWSSGGGLGFGTMLRIMAETEGLAHWTQELRWLAPELARHAIRALLGASATALVGAGLIWWRHRETRAAFVLLLVAIAELGLFAASHRGSFSASQTRLELPDAVLEQLGRDQRLFLPQAGNRLMEPGVESIWGYDPVQLARYVELLASTQEETRDLLDHSMLPPASFHRLFAMLRCGIHLRSDWPDPTGLDARRFQVGRGLLNLQARAVEDPLPRFLLVRDYSVSPSREATLRALLAPHFDPRGLVLLEGEPAPPPRAGSKAGRITLLDESTDHASLEIEIDAPAILLITDAYSSGWRARPLAPGPQQRYGVLPANHALMAIPLAGGHHRLRLEYAPASFRAGAAVSLTSAGILVTVAACWALRRRYRAGAVPDAAESAF